MYQSGRLNPRMRAFVVAEADRIGVAQAARNIGVSRNTVYRWRRHREPFGSVIDLQGTTTARSLEGRE